MSNSAYQVTKKNQDKKNQKTDPKDVKHGSGNLSKKEAQPNTSIRQLCVILAKTSSESKTKK